MARDPLADPAPLIRRVYAYVAYRIGDGAEAEDVTSETFERALRYRESYDPRRGEPVAWLIGIARRCIETSRLRPEPVAHGVRAADPLDLEIDRRAADAPARGRAARRARPRADRAPLRLRPVRAADRGAARAADERRRGRAPPGDRAAPRASGGRGHRPGRGAPERTSEPPVRKSPPPTGNRRRRHASDSET